VLRGRNALDRIRHLPPAVERILIHIGEPTEAPAPKPARGPPEWNLESEPGLDWEGQIAPEPELELDQRISW
jgi:hypothetical protein